MRFTRKDTGEPYNPDYVKLAEAYGAEGERVEDPDELARALRRAIGSRRPYVLDVPSDTEPPRPTSRAESSAPTQTSGARRTRSTSTCASSADEP